LIKPTQQHEALHMYELEYSYKQAHNGRWTEWFAESQHEHKFEAVQALGRHVSAHETFSARVVRYDETSYEPAEVVAEYKFKG